MLLVEQLWWQVAFLGHSCSGGVLGGSEALPELGDSCSVQASSAWEMLDHGTRPETWSSVCDVHWSKEAHANLGQEPQQGQEPLPCLCAEIKEA